MYIKFLLFFLFILLLLIFFFFFFFFSSRRRHTRCSRDWSSDVCSSDLSSLQSLSRSLMSQVRAEAQKIARKPTDENVAEALLNFVDAQVDVTPEELLDRKSTRLNSSHGYISYAVFCLKKKNKTHVE